MFAVFVVSLIAYAEAYFNVISLGITLLSGPYDTLAFRTPT